MNNERTIQDLPVTTNLDRPMSVNEVLNQSIIVHEILTQVMIKDIHYGTIPGCKKPSLYQPGAEKLCVTFRLAPKFEVEDLSEPHENLYRYRVKCSLYTIRDGLFVGSAMGEASTAEEKYQWEAALNKRHFDLTDPDKRRIKFKKNKDTQGGVEEILQVQQNAADLANTVLKMACKRALTSVTKGSTGASDIFDVDIEDEAVGKMASQQETAQLKMKAKPRSTVTFPYGKHKGLSIDDPSITAEDLTWWIHRLESSLKEGKNKHYERQNKEFITSLQAEKARREKGPQEPLPQPDDPQKMTVDVWMDLCQLWYDQDPNAYANACTDMKIENAKNLPSVRWPEFQNLIKKLMDGK